MKTKGISKNEAKREAKRLIEKSTEERKDILEEMALTQPERAELIKKYIVKYEEAERRVAEEEMDKKLDQIIREEDELTQRIKDNPEPPKPETTETQAEPPETKPEPVQEIEPVKETPKTDRYPGMVLWEWKPSDEEKRKEAPKPKEVKKVSRKKLHGHREKRDEERKEPAATAVPVKVPPKYISVETLLAKEATRKSFRKEKTGKNRFNSRHKLTDDNGTMIRFPVFIPAAIRGHEEKFMEETDEHPAYLWTTIRVPDTMLRVNVNLRNDLAPDKDGNITGEAEIGFNEISREGEESQQVQYMNVYPPNGNSGEKIYEVAVDLSKGRPEEDSTHIGPSQGMFVRNKQLRKAPADMYLHMYRKKAAAPQ